MGHSIKCCFLRHAYIILRNIDFIAFLRPRPRAVWRHFRPAETLILPENRCECTHSAHETAHVGSNFLYLLHSLSNSELDDSAFSFRDRRSSTDVFDDLLVSGKRLEP